MPHPIRPRARLRASLGALALVALGLLIAHVPAAQAGAPVLRDTYRDPVHKFSLRMFDGYKPVPLKPDERLVACRFRDPKEKGEARGTFPVTVEVLRLAKDGKDKPVTTGGGPDGMPEIPAEVLERMGLGEPKNLFDAAFRGLMIAEAAEKEIQAGKDKPKAIRSKDKVAGQMWTFEVASIWGSDPTDRIYLFLATFERDGVEYGISCRCGAVMRKHYAPRFEDIAESFRFFDTRAKDVESLDALDGVNISARRRLQIEQSMVRDWDVVVSPKKNYIVIYNTKKGTNHTLAKVIAERIELIREQIYEVQFPPARPVTKVCIVRVCEDLKEYHAYGGRWGSAGYWSPGDEELVFYDASASKKPDDDTLSVLYHEAFHQYIHYSVGEVAPHSWFNEGHGDYYAGAKLRGKKFVIKPFQWRVGTIRNAIVQGERPFRVEKDEQTGEERRIWEPRGYTPLKDLVNFSQGEYYSYPGVCYAQGWSLIYFLREEVPKNKKYAEKWGHILDTYFNVLKAEVNKEAPLQPIGEKEDPEPADGEGDGEGEGADEGTPPDPKEGDPAGPDAPPGGPAPVPPTPPDGPVPPDGSPPDGGPPDGEGGDGEPSGPGVAMQTWGRGSAAALKRAVEEAFKGVDWAEFQEAWLKATK